MFDDRARRQRNTARVLRRRNASVVLAALLATACKHEALPPIPQPAAGSARPVVVSAPLSATPPAAVSVVVSKSALPERVVDDDDCLRFNVTHARSDGYEGTVAGAKVFARLDDQKGAIDGRYFYAKEGSDIALVGKLLPERRIQLEERTGDQVTGRFDGTCDASGRIEGRWTKPDGTAAQPFKLESVTPKTPFLVTTKKRARSFPPQAGSPASIPQNPFAPEARCTESISWPEIFGAGDAEGHINAALRKDHWIFEGDAEKEFQSCTVGQRSTAYRGFNIELNESAVLVVSFHGNEKAEGSTHPYEPLGPEISSFDTRTGSAITTADLLASDEATKRATHVKLIEILDHCVRKGFDASPADLDQFILPRFVDEDATPIVYPTKEGLRFVTTGYPPAMRVWEGDGVTLRYAALLAAGVLRTDSPVARLWQGTKPSSANPCVARKK